MLKNSIVLQNQRLKISKPYFKEVSKEKKLEKQERKEKELLTLMTKAKSKINKLVYLYN